MKTTTTNKNRKYFLTTPRIGFSKWSSEDTQLAQQLWGNPQVTEYICAAGTFTEQQITNRLEAELKNQEEFHMQYWPIFHIETDEFIGCCGLRPYNIKKDIYEIGFHLCPEYWGKGLGSEAAKAIINYAFTTLKAKDLFAGHHPQNTASAKMLTKLGFHYTHDENYEATGLNHPSYLYKNA